MVAVVAPRARKSHVVRFVRRYFGKAPVTVYYDKRARAFNRLGPGYYPSHRFWSAKGRRVSWVPGYPFR